MLLTAIATGGFIAVELSYFPQILRLSRRGRAEDMSLTFPALNAFGRLTILVYAIAAGQPVFTWGFAVGSMLRLVLLVQVIYYRGHGRRQTSVKTEDASERRSALPVVTPSGETS